MKKTKDRVVGTLKGIFGSDMTMERRGCPECPLGTARRLELFDDLVFLLACDNRLSSCPSLRDQTIRAVGIEGPNDLLYCALR